MHCKAATPPQTSYSCKKWARGNKRIVYVIWLAVTQKTSRECQFQPHDGVFASDSVDSRSPT